MCRDINKCSSQVLYNFFYVESLTDKQGRHRGINHIVAIKQGRLQLASMEY